MDKDAVGKMEAGNEEVEAEAEVGEEDNLVYSAKFLMISRLILIRVKNLKTSRSSSSSLKMSSTNSISTKASLTPIVILQIQWSSIL